MAIDLKLLHTLSVAFHFSFSSISDAERDARANFLISTGFDDAKQLSRRSSVNGFDVSVYAPDLGAPWLPVRRNPGDNSLAQTGLGLCSEDMGARAAVSLDRFPLVSGTDQIDFFDR